MVANCPGCTCPPERRHRPCMGLTVAGNTAGTTPGEPGATGAVGEAPPGLSLRVPARCGEAERLEDGLRVRPAMPACELGVPRCLRCRRGAEPRPQSWHRDGQAHGLRSGGTGTQEQRAGPSGAGGCKVTESNCGAKAAAQRGAIRSENRCALRAKLLRSGNVLTDNCRGGRLREPRGEEAVESTGPDPWGLRMGPGRFSHPHPTKEEAAAKLSPRPPKAQILSGEKAIPRA